MHSSMFGGDDTRQPPELDPDVWEAFTKLYQAHSMYYGALQQAMKSGALSDQEIEACLTQLFEMKEIVSAADDEHEAAFNEHIRE